MCGGQASAAGSRALVCSWAQGEERSTHRILDPVPGASTQVPACLRPTLLGDFRAEPCMGTVRNGWSADTRSAVRDLCGSAVWSQSGLKWDASSARLVIPSLR